MRMLGDAASFGLDRAVGGFLLFMEAKKCVRLQCFFLWAVVAAADGRVTSGQSKQSRTPGVFPEPVTYALRSPDRGTGQRSCKLPRAPSTHITMQSALSRCIVHPIHAWPPPSGARATDKRSRSTKYIGTDATSSKETSRQSITSPSRLGGL